MNTENLSQSLAVVTHITPAAARAASSYVSPAIDAGMYARLLALLQVGTLAGSATVNIRFQHCSGSASSDAGWADISSASCISSAFASGSNDKIGELELRIDQNPSTSQYVRVLVSAATSTWIGGAIVLGEPRFTPATVVDSADVVQTVVY